MAIEFRTLHPGEVLEFLRPQEAAFGVPVSQARADYWATVGELDRMFVAVDRGQIVATGESHSLMLTTPGATTPMAGMASASVLPSHRRRGLMSELVRRRLDQARERGETMAGQWASEALSWGRWGFGWATSGAQFELRQPYMNFRDRPDTRGRIRLVSADEALKEFPLVYDRARAATPGMIDRSEARWRGWITEDPWHWQGSHWREDVGPRMFAAWQDHQGYVAYRLQRTWTRGAADHRALIAELIAVDDEAYAGLWQWCFELDLVRSIAASQRPVDEPFRLMLEDPRRLRSQTSDALRLRPVDVRAALQARRYHGGGDLVLEIIDPAGSWAHGRYRVTVDDGTATCVPSGEVPDISMPAASLGSAYLGGTPASLLVRAGLATEHSNGSAHRFDAMFTTRPGPWCPWVF